MQANLAGKAATLRKSHAAFHDPIPQQLTPKEIPGPADSELEGPLSEPPRRSFRPLESVHRGRL